MTDRSPVPRALVVLRTGEQVVTIATIGRAARADVSLVDDLLRFRLVGRRLGWSIVLLDVDEHLAELLDLVGVPVERHP